VGKAGAIKREAGMKGAAMGKKVMKKLMIGGLIVAMAAVGGLAKAEDNLQSIRQNLEKTFPQLKIDTIGESPVKGFYQITSGNQILFVNQDGYLFYGNIWSPDGKNVTVEITEKLMAEKLKKLPLDKALVIGSGPKKVIEFDDPECPFSRKANEFLAKRTDVTRYVFLFPLKQLHADAEKKSLYILAQKDRGKAFLDVLAGRMDGKPLPDVDSQVALLEEIIKIGQSVGIRATPTIWVDGIAVNGADIPRISALLEKKEVPSGKTSGTAAK
jgi:thiol:disulfide interchange protein DsbC